ncbi:MAG: winged helix-turn-helix domain-containing protein [Candidatus Micrarchaeota archaeon]
MEEDKIVLDRKSFEALAVDSRVKILKSLKERRKTLTEIASEQGMSVSGVKEHLETLEKVGLIEKKDDGHKWKYYELTRKGSDIVAPRELRVWILLSMSTIALVAAMFAIFSPPALDIGGYSAVAGEQAPLMEDSGQMLTASAIPPGENEAGDAYSEDARSLGASDDDAEAAKMSEGQLVGDIAPDSYYGGRSLAVPLAVAGISAVSLMICMAILFKNRMRVTSP